MVGPGAAAGFVYPSRWEAFGNALAEAAALGIPALATPYPLARDLAARQAPVVVVDADVRALRDGLVALLALGRGIRRHRTAAAVADAYSWKAVAGTWIRQLSAL